MQSADKLHDSTVAVLKSIETYHLAYRAAFKYPKREQLQKITHPLMLIYDENDPLNKYKDEAGLDKEIITTPIKGYRVVAYCITGEKWIRKGFIGDPYKRYSNYVLSNCILVNFLFLMCG